jgi:hypothetical protein
MVTFITKRHLSRRTMLKGMALDRAGVPAESFGHSTGELIET